jgi:hypothetical protein
LGDCPIKYGSYFLVKKYFPSFFKWEATDRYIKAKLTLFLSIFVITDEMSRKSSKFYFVMFNIGLALKIHKLAVTLVKE